MQTFLPYPDFKESAKCLDRQRLGKQRVEAWQILTALTGKTKGWRNHPATKMWRTYEKSLCLYGIRMCEEWIGRGYKDTMLPRFKEFLYKYLSFSAATNPHWLGNEDFHMSHRSNLLRKKQEYYSKFNWNIENNLPYIWPVQ